MKENHPEAVLFKLWLEGGVPEHRSDIVQCVKYTRVCGFIHADPCLSALNSTPSEVVCAERC